jgi:HTH-type transcriptional regulator / antitoxin HigA
MMSRNQSQTPKPTDTLRDEGRAGRAFAPTWVSPPGDTIADNLEERGWEQAELAQRTGFTKKHVNDLVKGRASLSPDAAQRLSTVLGSTTEFWLTREAQYQAALERRKARETHSGETEWLSELPLSWMLKQGLIAKNSDKAEQVNEALRWYGVASVEAWNETFEKPLVAFRASTKFAKSKGAVITWLRAVEIAAEQVRCAPYDEKAFRAALPSLRELTLQTDPEVFLPKMRAICAKVGIALVVAPAPPGCPVHGATRWLGPRKALLALSLRYRTHELLWFSFFHECAHLLKHSKKMLFVDGIDGLHSEEENEADKFAADLLIPMGVAPRLRRLKTEADVRAFAKEIGVAPGIVVGRMQHDKLLRMSQMNGLKQRYEWTADA